MFIIYAIGFLSILAISKITTAIYLFFLIIYRVLLSNISKNIAVARKLDIPKYWAAITFIFGTIGFVLFLLVNVKFGKKEKPYNNSKSIIVICVILGLSIIIAPLQIYEYRYNDEKDALNSVIYWDYNNRHFYSYDKMKNKYYDGSIENIDNSIYHFKYYDKNGNAYIYYYEYQFEEGLYTTGFVNEKYYDYDDEINEKYIIDDDCFCIDKSGYAHITEQKMKKYPYYYDSEFKESKYIYYDDNNIYYTPSDCSWDENGNLVFPEDSLLNDFDYNDIHK